MKRVLSCVVLLFMFTGCAVLSVGFTAEDLALFKNSAYTSGIGDGKSLVSIDSREGALLTIQRYEAVSRVLIKLADTTDATAPYTLADAYDAVSLLSDDPLVVAGIQAAIRVVTLIDAEQAVDVGYSLNVTQRDILSNYVMGIRDGLNQGIEEAKTKYGFQEEDI